YRLPVRSGWALSRVRRIKHGRAALLPVLMSFRQACVTWTCAGPPVMCTTGFALPIHPASGRILPLDRHRLTGDPPVSGGRVRHLASCLVGTGGEASRQRLVSEEPS